MTITIPRQTEVGLVPLDRTIELLKALDRADLGVDAALARSGLDVDLRQLADWPGEAMPLARCSAIVRAAEADLSAQLAARDGLAAPMTYQDEIIWLSALGCQTLANVVGSLQGFAAMLGGATGIERVRFHGGAATVELASSQSHEDALSFLSDAFKAIKMIKMMSWLIAEDIPVLSIHFRHPATFGAIWPEMAARLAVSWSHPVVSWSFPTLLLNKPVVRTQRDFLALMPLCPLIMDESSRSGAFAFAVGRILDEAIAQSQKLPDSRQLCVRLGCSPATLRRRLDEEGISLMAIKDARRCEWAISLLRQAPIVEVASRLGFADDIAFRRAFRRWTGRTPSSFRGR